MPGLTRWLVAECSYKVLHLPRIPFKALTQEGEGSFNPGYKPETRNELDIFIWVKNHLMRKATSSIFRKSYK